MLKALTLWQEITGIDPGSATRTIGGWELHRTFEHLQEALDLDPTEITANLLLSHLLNCYLTDHVASLANILDEDEGMLRKISKCRELRKLLNRPDLLEARDAFVAGVRKALEQYGAAERDDIKKLLAEPDNLAVLRRDALRSMANLRVDQFLKGDPEPATTRPIYVKFVHQWWNINSLLAQATHTPSGVSLNLIRDPSNYESFFAFAIRNGGNLFILSDVPQHAHPLASKMRRRPDRVFDERASRNWFPYDLMGVAYDEESGRLYFKESKVRALAPRQVSALPLKPVEELPAAELVWIAMMFDLIVDRFWKRGYCAKALSYTGEMLKSQDALTAQAKHANLPVTHYRPHALEPLSKADVATSVVAEEAVGEKHDNPNEWLEKRYGHLVPDDTLNIVDVKERTIALQHKTGALVPLSTKKLDEMGGFGKEELLKGKTVLDMVPATAFGTKDEMEKDRLFIARSNFAIQIDRLASEEFTRREKEIKAWYESAIRKNLPNLLLWAGGDALWVDEGEFGTFGGFASNSGCQRIIEPAKKDSHIDRKRRLMRTFLSFHDEPTKDWHLYGAMIVGGWSRDRGGHGVCIVKGSRASYSALFSPAHAHELALLAGCEVGDLPDVLQNWTLAEPYRGNSILQRIDPMIWKVDNPWAKMDFRVRVFLSKRGRAEISRQGARPSIKGLIESGVLPDQD